MSIKLKALGLGLLAMVAVGAFAAMNAGATVDGHFEFGSEHTFITGDVGKGTSHQLHVVDGASEMGCDIQQYAGTHKSATKTTTELTITPKWEQCYTTPDGTKFDVHENGCHLVFTSRANPSEKDGTVHVQCPTDKAIVITHPNCQITIAPQTLGGAPGNGVTYTTDTVEGVHFITVDIDVEVAVAYHNGICIFLGTNHTERLEGSMTVTAFANAAHTIRTSITAT